MRMIETGIVPASISGLATGTASWVRVSATGTLERVTPGSGDDIIGKAHADGSVQLHPGVWDSTNYAGGGGGSFTAGGDLSGSSSNQTVAKVNGTTITTAGGALAVGAVLRTTAVGTADWGAVNLADTDAVTGTLPKANQGAQDMAGDVTGTTAVSVVAKVNGITVSAGPIATGAVLRATGAAAAAFGAVDLADTDAVTGVLPNGNIATTLTGKTIAGASNTLTVRLANDVTGTLPVANGGTNLTALISAMGALNIDWSAAPMFTKTLSAGANTITFSNQVAGQTIIVRFTGAASTVTWPGGGSAIRWPGGAAPTQTASGTDIYTLVYDGTNTYGSYVQAMA